MTRALGVRLDDDVAELLGRGESAECLDVDLVGPARVVEHRRLVEDAGRDLCVLSTQCAQNIAGADIVRGGLVRIDPDPHGVLPLAQNPEIRHAGQARDLVPDMKSCSWRCTRRYGIRPANRVYAQEQGRDGLLDLHALELDLLGQPGQRVLHAVAA